MYNQILTTYVQKMLLISKETWQFELNQVLVPPRFACHWGLHSISPFSRVQLVWFYHAADSGYLGIARRGVIVNVLISATRGRHPISLSQNVHACKVPLGISLCVRYLSTIIIVIITHCLITCTVQPLYKDTVGNCRKCKVSVV